MTNSELYRNGQGNSLDSALYSSCNSAYSFALRQKLLEGLGGTTNPVITKHKTFISYHHKNDQYYKDRFEILFDGIFINKSVQEGDIDSDVSTEYIKRLIQLNHIEDSSVTVVLIGSETYKRKHVDWEISATLNKKVGGYSGVVGILLPTYNFGLGGLYNTSTIPPRLKENIQSGYAQIYYWTEDETQIKNIIQTAFDSRKTKCHLIKNSLEQFKVNRA